MGAILKAKMKKAGVKKPTFPGPKATELLNKELKKKQKLRRPGFSGSDIVESSARMRKGKPGKSFIELDARINRKLLRDFAKGAKMPKEYKGKK